MRNELIDGEFSSIERMPSETALAKMFNVSRNTIREALSVLENENLLVRKHGIGTFIKRDEKLSVGFGKARTVGFTETKMNLVQRTYRLNGNLPMEAYLKLWVFLLDQCLLF